MLTPYYEDAASGITIYHGDAREIIPSLPDCDLLITDPPYGVSGEQNSKTESRWAISFQRNKNDYETFTDSREYVRDVAVPAFIAARARAKRAIVTPGNRCLTYYPAPDSFGCLWQPASVGLQAWGRADSQPIFYYGKFPRESRLIPGQSLSFSLTEAPERNGHPCPKPLRIWTKLMLIGSLEGDIVLDPFMGSGTTLRAAKDQGRRAIGIDVCERYCEIAAKRLAQGVLFGAGGAA